MQETYFTLLICNLCPMTLNICFFSLNNYFLLGLKCLLKCSYLSPDQFEFETLNQSWSSTKKEIWYQFDQCFSCFYYIFLCQKDEGISPKAFQVCLLSQSNSKIKKSQTKATSEVFKSCNLIESRVSTWPLSTSDFLFK